MRQTLISILMIATLLLAVTSCSSGSDAVIPLATLDTVASSVSHVTQTHLWGCYDVYIDIESQTAEAIPNRQAMFTANVVTFLNGKLANLGFHINNTLEGPGYIDVDIDVSLTHPLPNQPQYNGYDVRGVFMGDGSATLQYNSDLHYPDLGTDQIMLADSVDGFGGPDGYTRWFNKPEFSTGGLPVLQYTQGILATPSFNGSATLNAYKYFADGLGKTDDLWGWLNNHANQHGQFSSGATNTRNYYLRFPKTKGTAFGYAVLANWGGKTPEFHPSNAPEAVACSVVDNSTLYYVDPTNKGGNLILDISLFGWSQQPSTIFIESTVLSVPYEFTVNEMIPIGGTENYSTYHVEIYADNVTGIDNNELWVIAQYNAHDYTNEFGVTNLANTDKLSTFFRHNLTVSGEIPAWIKVTSPNGGEEWTVGSNQEITWDSGGVIGTVFIEYSKDNCVSDIHTIATDEANDGSFMWNNIPNDPSDTVRVRVSSTNDPSVNDVSDANFAIVIVIVDTGWALTWGGSSNDIGYDVAVDGSGNVYVTGPFSLTADFDPGPGEDWHTYNGGCDVFLSKFNPSGTFLWTKTWGGAVYDYAYGVVVDKADNVYVTGCFMETVDFDPGPGEDWHNSNGGRDVFLSKLDSSGNFLWAQTWGGGLWDEGYDVVVDEMGGTYVTGTLNGTAYAFLTKFDSSGIFLWTKTWGGNHNGYGWGVVADGSGDVYVTGCFSGAIDFDPGSGVDNHVSNGLYDVFLSKFDSSGGFLWAKTWGGITDDSGIAVGVDGSGNTYVTGYFRVAVDFDPGPGEDWHNSNGSGDIFLSKFNSSGTFLWVNTWGGTGLDYGYAVTMDASANVYVAGFFNVTVDFDPGSGVDNHTSNGAADVFLSKFNSTGTFLWARTWGGTGDDESQSVAIDSSGNAYVTGWFYGTVDFDPGPGIDNHTSNGNYDAFLSKFLPDGSW